MQQRQFGALNFIAHSLVFPRIEPVFSCIAPRSYLAVSCQNAFVKSLIKFASFVTHGKKGLRPPQPVDMRQGFFLGVMDHVDVPAVVPIDVDAETIT